MDVDKASFFFSKSVTIITIITIIPFWTTYFLTTFYRKKRRWKFCSRHAPRPRNFNGSGSVKHLRFCKQKKTSSSILSKDVTLTPSVKKKNIQYMTSLLLPTYPLTFCQSAPVNCVFSVIELVVDSSNLSRGGEMKFCPVRLF